MFCMSFVGEQWDGDLLNGQVFGRGNRRQALTQRNRSGARLSEQGVEIKKSWRWAYHFLTKNRP